MIFKYREVDGEPFLTGKGCLLLLLFIPFWPIIFLGSVIVSLFSEALGIKRERSENSNAGSEYWWQQSYFKRIGMDPSVFWLTEVRYREVEIPKSTGGTRILSVPEAELKSLQAILASDLQKQLLSKVHKCANAYTPGRSTITNARPHLGCAVLIKLDIKQFFESVKKSQVRPWICSALRSNALTDRVIELVFSDRGLPQGAPTSPLLSNLVLRRLDIALYQECNRLGAIYTRYADDITISLKKDDSATIRYLIKMVDGLLKREGFVLNKKKEKLQVLRKHQSQRICGVTINSGRLTISRKKRRLLRAAKHRKAHDQRSGFTNDQLAGWDAYIAMVDNQ